MFPSGQPLFRQYLPYELTSRKKAGVEDWEAEEQALLFWRYRSGLYSINPLHFMLPMIYLILAPTLAASWISGSSEKSLNDIFRYLLLRNLRWKHRFLEEAVAWCIFLYTPFKNNLNEYHYVWYIHYVIYRILISWHGRMSFEKTSFRYSIVSNNIKRFKALN